MKSLSDLDWQRSNAHLLLLSKFLQPRKEDDFAGSDYWTPVLGEPAAQAIKCFISDGMLVKADLSAELDYRFTAAELKRLLTERGLNVSGRKRDLITRLVQADPNGIRHIESEVTILHCSDRGRDIAQQFISDEKGNRTDVERQVLEQLRNRNFEEASIAVASYEAGQVFSRGIGMDWKKHRPTRDISILNTIFNSTPKILSSVNDRQLEALRLAAGMIYLWGTGRTGEWLPTDLETDLFMDNDAAARMLVFHGYHKTNLAGYKESGVVQQVEILGAPNSCDACRLISGVRFKLSEVLELPYEHCTSGLGCRCTLVTVTDWK
jgi:hypothetical protein